MKRAFIVISILTYNITMAQTNLVADNSNSLMDSMRTEVHSNLVQPNEVDRETISTQRGEPFEGIDMSWQNGND